ncbi:penicillin-binding protein 2 [Paenibacillus sp. N3/727]|uniref:peptidoglycan D,D-transpeptidase FtsI family protein n=1 Tax=Paenibacillus sp. N3/727 TaxID=2925845 RepID=UPI001F52D71D|nr:penicillin-binding transpeptidase domain-containing protein [Paenibacillus sp. N3/727]UNK16128.1 penicillin-binding protein 2 [Paenibacillus sp. N3/727]
MNFIKAGKRKQDEGDASSQFNLRINIFFFTTFVIFSVIIIRLAILQFVEGPELTEQETSGRTKNFPLQPIRGSILDVAGTPLAYSKPSNALYVTLLKNYDPSNDKGLENYPEIDEIANRVVEVFEKHGDPKTVKMTKKEVIKELDLKSNKQGGYEPRRVKGDLTEDEVAYFIENKEDFPGIKIIEENIRFYDTDTVAVQAIGYLKEFKGVKTLEKYAMIEELNKTQEDPGLKYTESERVGVDGLEMMFQDELRGKNGYISIPINPQNMIDGEPVMIAPKKGHNVYTTIHKQIQMATEQAIVDQLIWLRTTPFSGKTHPDALTGYAVAMEVDTGNVVAMASIPDYDPNVWKDGTDDWASVEKFYGNGTISPYNSGRSGNNLESVLLMGSTIKPLSVLIGLNEGLFGVNDYYYDKGSAQIANDTNANVSNSGGKALGPIKPKGAIQNSSNAFMIDWVGEKLFGKYGIKGIDVWGKYMKEFGLGVSTESGLPKEHRGRAEYENYEAAGSPIASLAFASFGQGGAYTTLQLAQYTATLANQGSRIKPQMVSKIEDQKGNVIKKYGREVLNKVELPQKYWDEVIKGMNTQNLPSFNDFSYDFARKTGTSQQNVFPKGKKYTTDNGVFIAFAPRENPKLAVAVIIPEGGFGAYSAAPVARKIFDAYDEVYGLDGTPHPKKAETPEEGEVNESGESTPDTTR